MARDIEKLELLFRRQLAIESTKSPKRSATYRLDAVTSLAGNTGSAGVAGDCPASVQIFPRAAGACFGSVGGLLQRRTRPSGGGDLAACRRRDESEALREADLRASQRAIVKTNVSADLRARRLEHLELLRFYGFTFEVICDEAYSGTTREEQIELFKSKWGAALSIDLGSTHPDTFPAVN